jgi:hypothetical protein
LVSIEYVESEFENEAAVDSLLSVATVSPTLFPTVPELALQVVAPPLEEEGKPKYCIDAWAAVMVPNSIAANASALERHGSRWIVTRRASSTWPKKKDETRRLLKSYAGVRGSFQKPNTFTDTDVFLRDSQCNRTYFKRRFPSL